MKRMTGRDAKAKVKCQTFLLLPRRCTTVLTLGTEDLALRYQPLADAGCAAAQRRGQALPAEYVGKARRLDQRFCATQSGDVRPVERRLSTYGAVRDLVFGHWAETSEHVGAILAGCARCGCLIGSPCKRRRPTTPMRRFAGCSPDVGGKTYSCVMLTKFENSVIASLKKSVVYPTRSTAAIPCQYARHQQKKYNFQPWMQHEWCQH